MCFLVDLLVVWGSFDVQAKSWTLFCWSLGRQVCGFLEHDETLFVLEALALCPCVSDGCWARVD